MHISIDDGGLDRLEVDLRNAPGRMQRRGPQTLRKAAALVDREMTIDATGHEGNWFGRPGTSYKTPLERHVSHEMLDPWEAEIGIEYQGAGKLAHIIAKGSVNNAPAYDHLAAMRRSEPRILRMFGDTAEESVLGDER